MIKMMEKYRGKKVLIVGLGKTGFALINFFHRIDCNIRVTDIKPIFDLNKEVKRLKKMTNPPEFTLGEHKDEDFLEADVIIYGPSVDSNLPQLVLSREHGKEVWSEIGFFCHHNDKKMIAVCGSYGRTTIAHMIGFTLRIDKKSVFIGGTSDEPAINLFLEPNYAEIEYVILELSPMQIQSLSNFKPEILIYPNLEEKKVPKIFNSVGEYLEVMLKPMRIVNDQTTIIANFDKLATHSIFRMRPSQTYWYSRKSFVSLGVVTEVVGTHFHNKRINCNVGSHSEYVVSKMRIVGVNNRENLLAAITAAKTLNVSDKAVQTCVEKFPGVPNRLEFVTEKNGVKFYNDSKSETMAELAVSLKAFKDPIILIAGGRDVEQVYEQYGQDIKEHVRILVLVGECKENMNRELGHFTQTFLVGSFDESVLIAYQKSRTGDVILLCPGTSGTDIFRDYVEKGNYYKKLIFQL